MKQLFTFFIVLILLSAQAQESEKFNLGFESHIDEKKLADGWQVWDNYKLSIEALSHSGKKSGKITSDDSGSSFGSIAYQIPANYKGKIIQLRGFMKIENAENGFAGLLMRIDGDGETLVFDNMESQNITGTKDWKEYTITLNYPEGAKNIYIAGILVGKGEAWFDDFVLSIDGNDVQSLKEVEEELLKAQLDNEFDTGSLIEIENLSPVMVKNLELLGRVWGFLKYHHPEIGKGNYNWDYELFRFLPDYLVIDKKEKRDKSIVDWIDSLGKINECKTCISSKKNSKTQEA